MFTPPVLIVDDDPDTRETLSDLLVSEGYDVQSVALGADALEQVRHNRFGAVLLDIQLPDLNGLSVLKVLTELDPHLPIIVLTGHASAENTIGSLIRGAFAYLTKPYNSQEVKAVLRRAVSVKDLAERAEHVEQALRASEDRFRVLVESATDAIILADHGGYIISWNNAAERVFGYSKEEALGRPLTVLMPERYRQAHEQGLARLIRTGESRLVGKTLELMGLTKQGQEFPLELSLASWQTQEGRWFSGIIRDITERKRTGAELERLSRHNQLLLNSAGEGIYGLDAQGRTTFVNPAAARMLGWDAAELIGQPMHAILHHSYPDGNPYPRTACPIYAAFKDGLIHHVQDEIFWRKDGTSFPVEYVSTPIREQETLAGAVVVFRDISERKRAEGLQQAQLAVSHILATAGTLDEAMPQLLGEVCGMVGWDVGLIWRIDLQANVLRCAAGWPPASGGFGEFLHLNYATAIPFGVGLPGRVWASGQPAQILDMVQDQNCPFAPTAARVGLHGAFAFPIKSGGALSGVIEFFSRSTRDPNSRLMQAMSDIGIKIAQFIERKRADNALRRASEETENILASLPGAILISDGQHEIIYANGSANRTFGQEGTSLVGRRLPETLPMNEAARHRFRQQLDALVTGGSLDQQDVEFEAGKRVFRYRLFSVALRGNEQPQTGMVVWDVTEARQLRDQLVQAEKLSSLGTLVSGMAHEVNNPAQAILSMAELILDEQNPDRIREYASDIVGYARHVSDVVRDFAGYARAVSLEGEGTVDLRERLTEAVKMVRRGPHFGYVNVVTHFEPVPHLTARKAEIEQLFVNLISNAVQAMKGRGQLTLATALEGDSSAVRIADTGCGIPQTILHKIFDPFFTTKEPGKGTGLGLSIVHKIVTKYGGVLHVDSEENKGTTFTIRFPAKDARTNPD